MHGHGIDFADLATYALLLFIIMLLKEWLPCRPVHTKQKNKQINKHMGLHLGVRIK